MNGRSASVCGHSCGKAEGCVVNMCGMCPSCVFAPKPAGSGRCLWKVSDEVKRRFVVQLLLRCGDVRVLESVQSFLGGTSWTLFTYARSRRPQRPAGRGSVRSPGRNPLDVDVNEIWDWFSSSPGWIRSRYLCHVLALCEPELLRMVANLTSVLLVRRKQGFLQNNAGAHQHHQVSEGDSEEPALMVVPGSSQSVSGVSRYRDFIGCLPVDMSKRILGLLDEHILRRCQKVCRYWKHLAGETIEEIHFKRIFQDQVKAMMKRYKSAHLVSPTYANIVEVPVPEEAHENMGTHCGDQKVRPFEAAYADIKTKTVPMEERNVYCGAYFTKVLLNKEDSHRVVDYSRGGSLLATGSKDRLVRLFHVASETTAVAVLKGHVGSIRAVLLCEERDLVITASWDASIRCWNLKTDQCVMALYGHTGTVNCLDVHADRLVSGAKDRIVKVWSLHTGKHFEDFNFKHPSSIQCVKISATRVYSSCDRGLIKIWDMENAALLRVINAHRSSVKCLFFDTWHLVSGDCSGQVMAWSIHTDAKECLMTFSHAKEVKSLTLSYLRVVTGCVDGKIRIFNLLTGECLRDIIAEAETGCILSLHFHDNSILVNTTSSVKLFQFAKVFWDYKESAEGDQVDVTAQGGSVSDKSAASLRKLQYASVRPDHVAPVASPTSNMHSCKVKTPDRAEVLHSTRSSSTPTKCRAQDGERCESSKKSVTLSEKETLDRIKKRGLHRPPTRDSILLRVNAIQRARCTDEVSVNMEHNDKLRDSWGPCSPGGPPLTRSDPQEPPALKQTAQHSPYRRAQTCIPQTKRTSSLNMTNALHTQRRLHPPSFSKTLQRTIALQPPERILNEAAT